MYELVIHFSNRQVCVELWNDKRISRATSNDASAELLDIIDATLIRAGITLSDIAKIGYFRGPGSFTSARILYATCRGLAVFRNIELYGLSLDQIIPDQEIYLDCNSNLSFYFNKNDWSYVPKTIQCTELPDLGSTIKQLIDKKDNLCSLGPVYICI